MGPNQTAKLGPDQSSEITCAHISTPRWATIVLRTVGTVNTAAALLGASFLVDSVYRILTGHITEPRDAPYFRFAFWVMALVQLAFLGVLLVTAIRFIQAKLSAVNLYSLTVLLLVGYFVATGELWRGCDQEIAASVASATGGADIATAPFTFLLLVPFLYPVASVVLVQVLKRRYDSEQTPISA